jgi:hypothetical protein
MKAIVHNTYGSPDVLELQEVDKPDPTDDEVLVRVRAASVNPADWYGVAGRPYVGRVLMGLRKPKSSSVRIDFAGTVEAVGRDVTEFRAGDEVFGRSGAFAEYVCVRADEAVALKPASLTFEQAAAVPVAALTALQSLRDKSWFARGRLRSRTASIHADRVDWFPWSYVVLSSNLSSNSEEPPLQCSRLVAEDDAGEMHVPLGRLHVRVAGLRHDGDRARARGCVVRDRGVS